MSISDVVTPIGNRGWDPRILVCQYDLTYHDLILPMYVNIVVTKRYVVIVDTLVNEATAAALADIARPHLKGKFPLAVNTHADYDHAWGNYFFTKPDSPFAAPIIGTKLCAERLRSTEAKHELSQWQSAEPDAFASLELSSPSLTFDNSLHIDGGDLTLQLIATPGHTHDHCSIYIPEIKTLLAGDAAESPFPASNEGAVLELLRSLYTLQSLDLEAAFYCHAPVNAGPELLAANIRYLEKLRSACSQALESGSSVEASQIDAIQDAELEDLVGYSYQEAVSTETAWALEPFNRPAHQSSIRAMLTELSQY